MRQQIELHDDLVREKQRKEYIDAHPELPEKFKDAIRIGSAEEGMTKEEVRASDAHVPPHKVERENGVHEGKLYDEVWTYKGSPIDYLRIYFKDGIVVGFGS